MTQYLHIEHAHRLARDGIADIRNALLQLPEMAKDCRALNDVLLELPNADRFCIPGITTKHSGSAARLEHFRIPALSRPLSVVFAPNETPRPGRHTPAVECIIALPVTDGGVPPEVHDNYRAEGIDHHGAWIKIVDAYMRQDRRWFVTPYAAYLPCGTAPEWRTGTDGGLEARMCAFVLLPGLAAAIAKGAGRTGVRNAAADACGTACVWLWFEAMRSCANIGVARSYLNDGDWSDYFVSKADPSRALYSGHVQPNDHDGALWVPGSERSPYEHDAGVRAFLHGANAVPADPNHRLN
ncbi:MAG TPA: hypothetical protein VF292_03030 [Rhodanobacteraceae bacterium]